MSQRILIIKPSSLGDIVHALPTLSVLRAQFPDFWIGWVVKEEWAEILRGHPDLNEVIAVNFRLTQWVSLVRRIRRLSCDVVIDLQGLFRSGLLAKLSGARERIGFAAGREGSPMFYTQRVELPNPQQMPWRLLDMHAVDRNLMVAQHLGADITQPRFILPSISHDEETVAQWFAEAGVDSSSRLIAMAPVSRQAIKNWPFDRFLETAAALSVQEECRIVLLGSASQRWMVQPFRDALGNRLIDLVGKTHVRHLGVVLRKVHLLIANDSAVLHMASALETPVLSFFGPTSALATGPYGKGIREILNVSLPCRPCGMHQCHNSHYLECLTAISVEQVLEKAKMLLRRIAVVPVGGTQ
ncbi:MAG: hypothetical protein GKS05_06170 [Nitrospirales bacterium]|nr:hypothetical protein [Nitrospirales bacterium]